MHPTDISSFGQRPLASRRASCLSLWIAALALLASTTRAPAAVDLRSPSGDLVVSIDTRTLGNDRACPAYRVTYKGRPVVTDSRLGLDLDSGPLSKNLTITAVTPSDHDDTWKPLCGERDTIRDHYTATDVDLKETTAPGRLLRLTFRAYDHGVAFRYTLPEQPNIHTFTIATERTQFAFTADHPAWAVYRAQGNYAPGPVPLSAIKPGAERPLTIKLADDLYAAVTEARCVDYARMKLQPDPAAPHTLIPLLDGERGASGTVTASAPFTSPWRVIMVADSPGQLLEHDDLILNLNDPCQLPDTSWIKPGKVMRETTLTTAGAKACIDFCRQRNMQYILFDAGWYGPERDPKSGATTVDPKRAATLDLPEVIRYGNDHGVGLILYVNHVALERQLDTLFPLYEKWGVKGVKFGFVNVGSQHWTAFLHDAIRTAAAHHLMVDIHDEFRDTGFRRTYPNLMTVEGVYGNEEFPTPAHNATLPFTRFLTGPADYTYCWYSPRLKVTHAHQLALSTIYFSPWQVLFWYDKPAMYDGDPALDYWKDLPTCWDETRVLKDDIGRTASVARRHGNEWFVGTINPAGGDLQLPLSFLPPNAHYTATTYIDRDPNDPKGAGVKIDHTPVDHLTTLTIQTAPNGGHTMRITPTAD